MKNTIVVKNLTLRIVLANKEISDLLVKHTEMERDNANSIAKILCQKFDEIVRTTENPTESLVSLLAR